MRFENLASSKKLRQSRTSNGLRGSSPERDHGRSGVLALVRILDGSLLDVRRWQIWMRAFRICGRSLDGGPGRAYSLLDFLFSRRHRIVRDVQRAILYFGFDYAVQRFDRIGYFLLMS